MISSCGNESIKLAEERESVEQAEDSDGVEQPEESESVAEQAEESGQENLQSTVTLQGTGTQTEIPSVVGVLTQQLSICQSKIATLQAQAVCCQESLQKEDTVKFYTGLPNLQVLNVVFNHVAAAIPTSECQKLTSFQEFMVVMMKLRLNCHNKDLAFRFNISPATVSRLLLKWLIAMDERLRKVIIWPDRESLQKTMPDCF